jgi:hypothetical protein
MFDFARKKQFAFGAVSADDDRDIEVHQLRRESRNGIWSESLKLFRDIILVLAVFVLLGRFCRAARSVEGNSMLSEIHDGER